MSLTKVSYSMIEGSCINAADYGFSTTASGSVNKAALNAAIAAMVATGRGGIIQLPLGNFTVDPTIIITGNHITLQGWGNAMEYGPTDQSGTVLTFTAGTVGINATFIDGATAGSYTVIKDLTVAGNGLLQTGILIDGMVTMQGVQVGSCTNHGIHMTGYVNTSSLQNCSVINNRGNDTSLGIGLLIDTVSGGNTPITLYNFLARDNNRGVIVQDCQLLLWDGGVSEQNTKEGLLLRKVVGGNLNNIKIQSVWFEQNYANTVGGYQVVLDANIPDYSTGAVFNTTFDHCVFNMVGASTVGKNIDLIAARKTRFITCISTHGGGASIAAIRLGTYSLATEIFNLETNHELPQIANIGSLNYFSQAVLTPPFPSAPGGQNVTCIYPDSLRVTSGNITQSVSTGTLTLDSGSVLTQTYKVSVTRGFTGAATTADVVIATLPAKTRLISIIADTITTWSGGGVTACTQTIGTTAGGAQLIASYDCFTAAVTKGLADADMGTSMTRAAAVQGGTIPSWTATTPIYLRITTTTANTNALTQGETVVYLITERFS